MSAPQVKLYPPGSDAAIAKGCTCPVLDNGRGRGAYVDIDGRPLFWISEKCPLHASESPAVSPEAPHGGSR